MTTMREDEGLVQPPELDDAPEPPALPIAAVERDTGLSKDSLRMWERRYGFPRPQRDAQGERAYPLQQVERLRRLKRLIDVGHRPGRVMALDDPAIDLLLSRAGSSAGSGSAASPPRSQRVPEMLALLQRSDLDALRHGLQRDLAQCGLVWFVRDLLTPLSRAVGEAWLSGEVAVHQEHAYTEVVERLLHQALGTLPPVSADASPRVLMTTLPGEPHGLGLLMAEVLLRLDGASCISLGVQTPPPEVVQAATAHRAQVVALALSGCTPERSAIASLQRLRHDLPRSTALWVGGRAPFLGRRAVAGVTPVIELDDLPDALAAWRQSRTSA